MHRTIEITVPAPATGALLAELQAIEDVVGLSVQRGASVRPPGDVVVVHTLNRAADDVLRAAARAGEGGAAVSVVTSEVASLSDPEHQRAIDRDLDEAIWEELEAGLRHQGRLTHNYLALMALGGAIAAAGLLSPQPEQQLTASVAAAVVAPGFEPVARIALGLQLRRWEVLRSGIVSTLAGYAVLVLAAALAYLGLQAFGAAEPRNLLESAAIGDLAKPSAKDLTISLCGALAGMVIQSSFRQSVIAGALIAMRIIDAAALIGLALVIGRLDLAGQGLERFGIDVAFILGAGFLVFGLKQAVLHRRQPLH